MLHAFAKKTQKTTSKDLDRGKARLAIRAGVPRHRSMTEDAMKERITRSSGNVFDDLGFPQEEAENLRIRATLMVALRRIIDEAGITQAQAAAAFSVSQPRISDLVRGRIDLFSIDALVNMLAAAGHHVEVSVEPEDHRAESCPARPHQRERGIPQEGYWVGARMLPNPSPARPSS